MFRVFVSRLRRSFTSGNVFKFGRHSFHRNIQPYFHYNKQVVSGIVSMSLDAGGCGRKARTPSPHEHHFKDLRIDTTCLFPDQFDAFLSTSDQYQSAEVSTPTTPNATGAGRVNFDETGATTNPSFASTSSGQQYKTACHVVGYAPEGTASRCRVCGSGFEPHGLRFGTFFSHAQGFIFLRWHHLPCLRPPSSLEDITTLSGHCNLSQDDVKVVRGWIDGNGVAPASLPLSPFSAFRSSPSFADSDRENKIPAWQTLGSINDDLCSSDTSINSNMNGNEWESRPRGIRPGQASPLSPPLVWPLQDRIVELADTSTLSTPSHSSGCLGVIANQSTSSFIPISSPVESLLIRKNSERERGAQELSHAGLFSTSPPRSDYMIDRNLPSPREMSRSRGTKFRAETPIFSLTGKNNLKVGESVELTAQEEMAKAESEMLRQTAKIERHRRQSRTI